MQQINAPRPPAWRDPVRLHHAQRTARMRPVLLLLSLASCLFLVIPPDLAYDEPISLQLARGCWSAWCLFILLGATLIYVARRLREWENHVWSIAAIGVAVGLGIIAFTNPFSASHNATFLSMTGLMLLGHVGFFYGHFDLRLLPSTVLAFAAAFLCFTHLGLGERLLIVSSLLGLNVLIYGHLDV